MGYEVSRTRGALIAISFAVLLSLTLLLAAPLEAQKTDETEITAQTSDVTATVTKDGGTTAQAGDVTATTAKANGAAEQSVQQGGQQAQADSAGEDESQTTARAADPLANEPARITEASDDGDSTIANRIVTADVDCEVSEGATLTVSGADGTQVRLTDGGNVDITQRQNQIVVVGTAEDGNLDGVNASGEFGPSNGTETGTVVRSTGITCDRDVDDNDAGGGNGDGNTGNGGGDTDNLECDELLQQFRSKGDDQYGDEDLFVDVDVRKQLIVCLEEEVVGNTAADEQLPDTGGLSLLGLAALGLVSAVVGASVIRGARR